ncbi:MAG: MFS transporter [Acidobacteriaceae bacterium]|nr:MFS transporter [Acidobacteriaceae bacterium]
MITIWLTVSTILNLISRQTLSILAPFLRDQFQISVVQYSHIVAAFMIAYGVMYAVSGWFVDKVGERLGMSICIIWWSVSAIASGFAVGVRSLGFTRFMLGIGEPGNYPAALKATARWFPQESRGLPVAFFSTGSAIGNIFSAPLIAFVALRFGWRAAFILPGLLGLLWYLGWLGIYPRQLPGNLPMEEQADQPSLSTSWVSLFKNRRVVGLIIARLISDPVNYFYVFWIPEYLKNERNFTLTDIGRYAWIPFVAGAIGGMFGGRFSDVLIRRGVSPAKARLGVIYVAAAVAPLGILTSRVASPVTAIALMSLMSFIVYIWFINTAAVIPDIAPPRLSGSILGLIGSAGSLSGFLFMLLIGFLVNRFSSYNAVFAIVGSVHILAAIVLWIFMRGPSANTQALKECHET